MNTEKTKEPGIWQSFREVWSLAAPSSAVFFMVSAANLITIKIVSELGPDAIAATTTGGRFYNLFSATLISVSAGTLALVSRAYGEKNLGKASSLLTTSMFYAFMLGIFMATFMIIITPYAVSVFGLSPQATAYSVIFIQWFSLSFVSIAVYVIMASGLRAAGDARSPMIFAAIINLFIVFFTYWFTYGGYGITGMGIKGAAIGTVLGNFIGIVIALTYWWKGKLKLKPASTNWQKRREQLQKLWRIGYPAALEQWVMQFGFLAFLWIVADYGTAAYAAYGAGVTLLTLTMVIGYGFSIAGSILVGQQLGANNPEAAKQAGWRAMRQSVIILTSLSLLIAPFAEELAYWLVNDEEVAKHTVWFVYLLCLSQPFMAIDMALGGALRGAGDTRFPLMATITGLVIIRFGLAFLFMKMELPVIWIYATMLADYGVKNLLFAHRFHSGRWIKSIG